MALLKTHSFIFNVILLLGLQVAQAQLQQVRATGACGTQPEWVPYKDEKCFKILNTYQNWETAAQACVKEYVESELFEPTLANILSQEEQEFLATLIFTSAGIEGNAWIGGSKNDKGEFAWTDGSVFGSEASPFTSWAAGSPIGQDGRNCVEMLSPLGREQSLALKALGVSPEIIDNGTRTDLGQWRDVSCSKGNVAVCQKTQAWSLGDLTRQVLDLRSKLKAMEEIQRLNKIPIGFIYTQLPGQPAPTVLWPGTKWESISSQYAGLFFRIEGGGATEFGASAQPAFSPVLTRAEQKWPLPELKAVDIVPGQWSQYLWTGDDRGGIEYAIGTRFLVSGGETRPINRAVRLWKKVA